MTDTVAIIVLLWPAMGGMVTLLWHWHDPLPPAKEDLGWARALVCVLFGPLLTLVVIYLTLRHYWRKSKQ